MLVPASNKILDDCDLGWCGRVFQLQVLDCFQFLAQKEQIWINDGWYTKFNRPSDSKDTGFGHSSEDVAAFKSPDVETLLGYHRAVLEQTKDYLANLPKPDLDREISGRIPTLGARLVAILSDNLQHAGQVAYLRGLLKPKG